MGDSGCLLEVSVAQMLALCFQASTVPTFTDHTILDLKFITMKATSSCPMRVSMNMGRFPQFQRFRYEYAKHHFSMRGMTTFFLHRLILLHPSSISSGNLRVGIYTGSARVYVDNGNIHRSLSTFLLTMSSLSGLRPLAVGNHKSRRQES